MEMTTTPSKAEIVARALEHYHRDNPHILTNPEEAELKESGYLFSATSDLMISESRKHAEWLELRENPQDFEFDLNEGLRSGTMIIGGKGTGKTNLAKLIAKEYIAKGNVVKVFDVSSAWLENTPIPNYVEVVPNTVLDIPLHKSCVFDLSKLYVKQIKSFIAQVIAQEFRLQVNTPKALRKWIIYTFEDSVISLPRNRLSSIEAEEIMRLITVGRNYDLGYIGIVQRPALSDTTVFELSAQKYIGRLDGENDKRKLRNYIGKEYVQQLEGLRIGEFLYDFGDTTKKICVPLFTSESKPKQLKTSMLEQQPQQQPNFVLGYAAIALVFLVILVIVNALFR